ncbi:uncharacterized protein LOC141881684 isoform X1 [Acropora palmata]|uniref:uncharacterized protein LOC141881684 isoform X1 n=1 Tax=Acropora palmata TaxID=6131 RepID=UPI003DA0159E
MRRWMKRHHFSLSSIAKKDFYPVFAESMENDSAVVQSESSVSQGPVAVSLTPGRPTEEANNRRANLKRKAQEELKEAPPCKLPRIIDYDVNFLMEKFRNL